MKSVNMIDMYNVYSKTKTVNELKKSLLLRESGEGYALPESMFEKVVATLLYETEDSDMTPTTFQIDLDFNLIPNLATIKEDFSEMVSGDYMDNYKSKKDKIKPDTETPEDSIDSETDKAAVNTALSNTNTSIDALVNKNLSTPESEKEKSVVLDEQELWNAFNKKLSNYAISNKTREMVKTGMLHVGDFIISDVTYSSVSDLKLTFKHFMKKYNENSNDIIKLSFGYSLTVASKNDEVVIEKKVWHAAAKNIIKDFQDTILVKSDYFDFAKPTKKMTSVKKIVAPTVPPVGKSQQNLA